MQSNHFKVAVAKNSAIERTMKAFAKLVGDCDQVEFGVFSTSSAYNSATDDEKARDILAVASLVNSAYALTPIHRVNTLDDVELVVAKPQKVYCDKCGFNVNPHGHEERCEFKVVDPQRVKTVAWLGDSLLAMHVRILLTASVGLDGGKFQMFTSNSRLSTAYEYVSTAFLGSDFVSSGISAHSRGTAVEAAYAMSYEYRYRLMEYFSIADLVDLAFADASLSQTLFHLVKTGSLITKPNKFVFGYCYMSLLPDNISDHVAKTLGPFPSYGRVKEFLVNTKIHKKWYISHQFSNIYHVSLRIIKGVSPALSYSNDLQLLDTDILGAAFNNIEEFSDTESDDGFSDFMVKDKDISSLLVNRELSSFWGSDNIRMFSEISTIAHALIAAGGLRPWLICVSQETYDVFVGVFKQPPATAAGDLQVVLQDLTVALTSLVQLVPVSQNNSYIGSSGIASLIRR